MMLLNMSFSDIIYNGNGKTNHSFTRDHYTNYHIFFFISIYNLKSPKLLTFYCIFKNQTLVTFLILSDFLTF